MFGDSLNPHPVPLFAPPARLTRSKRCLGPRPPLSSVLPSLSVPSFCAALPPPELPTFLFSSSTSIHPPPSFFSFPSLPSHLSTSPLLYLRCFNARLSFLLSSASFFLLPFDYPTIRLWLDYTYFRNVDSHSFPHPRNDQTSQRTPVVDTPSEPVRDYPGDNTTAVFFDSRLRRFGLIFHTNGSLGSRDGQQLAGQEDLRSGEEV